MRRLVLLAALASAAGCGNDIAITKQSQCDGILQGDEGDSVDSPFDADQDGAFDASNPDCAATYAAQFLDCDDADPAINPNAPEICNDLDDDCNPETPDGDDLDGDGYTECDDCADSVPEVNPGAVEVLCNDLDDDCDEATPDGSDADGDGATECLDCNDSNADIGPGATETLCNGVDDDCDEATPDGADIDADGWTQCDDCDDSDGGAFPGGTEVCDNGVDDDCNGDIDDGCAPVYSDYSGTWDLDSSIYYSCALSNVVIDFDRVLVTDASPTIDIDPLGSGTDPGGMSGTFSTTTDFSAENVQPGSCRESYTFSGTFTSMTSFSGTFTATYSGGSFACLDCSNQTWTVNGSR